MTKSCCAREQRVLALTDGRQMSVCKQCGDAKLIASAALRVPSLEDYNGYLESEITSARVSDRSARWYKGKAIGYENESRLKAFLELEVQVNQYFNLDNGDDCEIRYGSQLKKGWVRAIAGQRITISTEVFPDGVVEGEEVQIRRPQSLGLAMTLQQVFEMLCGTTDDANGLVRPQDLPPLDDSHKFTAEVPEELNDEQVEAIEHALRVPPQGIGLIQGPPGTGKTTVIAHLVRILREAGKTVLVTAHTHVAIDNALERAIGLAPQLKSEIARLGTAAKISDAMEAYYRSRDDFENNGTEAGPLAALFETYPVVGMTLASLAGRMKSLGEGEYTPFDYVIVDEASMNLLPMTLVARAASHQLILVGDHMQLPPIIKDEAYAKRSGFARSAFEQIALARPDLVCQLRVQYRSLPGIMAWSNKVLYNGTLVDNAEDAVLDVNVLGTPVERTLV